MDGFSDVSEKQPFVPDFLFFGAERAVPEIGPLLGESRPPRARGLLEVFRDYKFTVEENTPLEQDIALDPELLGRVFENLLAAVNPETGIAARKATGSFYTPREIVNYMVEEALYRHFGTVLTSAGEPKPGLEERLRQLVSEDNGPHRLDDDEAAKVIGSISRLRVLDPACGSGAFPMGALHKLVQVLGKLDPHNERWKAAKMAGLPPEMREKAEQVFREESFNYTRKLELIKDCIYGVDIQPAAIQICKLRFFLSLVIEQEGGARLRPLPNLETKFICANTLLSPARMDLRLFRHFIEPKERAILNTRSRYFFAQTKPEKDACKAEDRRLRRELSEFIQNLGGDVVGQLASAIAAWDPYHSERCADYFDPESMFGIGVSEGHGSERGAGTLTGKMALINQAGGQMEMTDPGEVGSGFDIVIANPPYVRQEHIKELKPKLDGQYDCYSGVADLYVYFYERSFRLLRAGGVLAFISSNKYFRSGYGKKLREFLAHKATICQLIDFGDAPVFEAIAYPSIVVLQKTPPEGSQTRVFTWEPGPPIEEFTAICRSQSFLMPQKGLMAEGWQLESPAVLRLLEKLRHAGKPLGEYMEGRFYRGIVTGLNEAFVVDREARDRLIAAHPSSAEVLKPFLRGRDVKRWRVEPQDLWLIFTRHGIDIKKYPAVLKHLEPFRKELTAKPDKWDEAKQGRWPGRKAGSYQWYEIQDNIAYCQEYEKPKIVYPDIYEHQNFALDSLRFYSGNTTYFIPTNERWLCGLLNSSTIEWFYSLVSNKVRGGYMRAFSDYMQQIPIPLNANPEAIEAFVDRVLALKGADPAVDVSELERQIDEMVYRLYGLTRDEIAIVEGR